MALIETENLTALNLARAADAALFRFDAGRYDWIDHRVEPKEAGRRIWANKL